MIFWSIAHLRSTVCPTCDKEGRKGGGGGDRREERGRGEKVVKPCAAYPRRTEEGYAPVFLTRLATGTCLTNCRCPDAKIDTLLESQFGAGRLYASISSRPGQVGRADGYILEGKELEVGFKLSVGVLCEIDCRNDDDLVLLEEVADREAEACVVDTTMLRWRWWCLRHRKRLLGVSCLVTLC